ncbi:MAG: NAD(P)H-dependent oxidoreductase [Actinomycetota bacterium]|nr:NAD(P)H-dependent oxidoreductase [Actinomycetota bacterium]
MTEEPHRYLALNCSLKSGEESSSTDVLLSSVTSQLESRGYVGTTLRVVDEHVAFGVTADEGAGDGWPRIRTALLAADVLVLGTPIWLGHPASVCQVVLERLDAFLSDTDERGQMRTVDRVAMVAVVGNEDGAHHVIAETFQGLNDCGFSLAPGAATYWVGEAMGGVDLKDLDEIPEKTATTTSTMVRNAVHLVERLRGDGRYPALESAGD